MIIRPDEHVSQAISFSNLGLSGSTDRPRGEQYQDKKSVQESSRNHMCLPGSANCKPLTSKMAIHECNSELSTVSGHAYRLRVLLQPAEHAVCAHVGRH